MSTVYVALRGDDGAEACWQGYARVPIEWDAASPFAEFVVCAEEHVPVSRWSLHTAQGETIESGTILAKPIPMRAGTTVRLRFFKKNG